MKKLGYALSLILLSGVIAAGCGNDRKEENEDMPSSQAVKIDAEQAKKMMDDEEVIIVDVRTEEEFSDAHIDKALLLTLDQIESKASSVIPDKEATYLLYCRSGNRSSQAAGMLVEMGYTEVYDFGGILDWPYGTVSGRN